MDVIEIIASILGLAIGIIVGYFIRKNISETKIGEAKALNIIDYRNTNGEFKDINELKNVTGIGESIFEKIKDNIKL